MLFSLLKQYLDTDTALKVFQSVYCFTTNISHGIENYLPRLWGTGISDAIFFFFCLLITRQIIFPIDFSPLVQFYHCMTDSVHSFRTAS